MQSPISYFRELTAPRVERSKEHMMEDIIFITIAAVICGAETWNDIESYGKSKETWLRQYLQLPNGIPSHDFCGFPSYFFVTLTMPHPLSKSQKYFIQQK